MSIGTFVKALIIYIASALIIYAVSPFSMDFLWKLLALAFGAALLTPFIYPHVRGVRKGDSVYVELAQTRTLPGIVRILINSGSGIAMENGRIGSKLMVMMNDGSFRQCVILRYPGLFSPTVVREVKPGVESPAEISVV